MREYARDCATGFGESGAREVRLAVVEDGRSVRVKVESEPFVLEVLRLSC